MINHVDGGGRSVTYLLIQRFREGTAITEQNERTKHRAKGCKVREGVRKKQRALKKTASTKNPMIERRRENEVEITKRSKEK